MADRSYACIHIGGEIKNEYDLKSLRDMLSAERYIEKDESDEEFLRFLATHLDNDRLFLEDEQARYSILENIEKFCQEEGLPYVRCSSAYFEYPAWRSLWKPGFKQPIDVTESPDGDAYINVDDLRKVLDLMNRGEYKQAQNELDSLFENLPTEFDIPPFEIKIEPYASKFAELRRGESNKS